MKWMNFKTREGLDRWYYVTIVLSLIASIGTYMLYSMQGVEPYQIAKLTGGTGITTILGMIFLELRFGRDVKC